MKLNADLKLPALVKGSQIPWAPSPLPGVDRRMLERDGDEVARVTSLVRYAPGSHFKSHVHVGGEEYFVLEGTFSDASGDYPAGTYVRNPVGSSHRPHSAHGCTILVKLYWMHKEDQEQVHINTHDPHLWQDAQWPGIEEIPLHAFEQEKTLLFKFGAGASLPERTVPGGEEFFILQGDAQDSQGTYGPQTWKRQPIGNASELHSTNGCILLYKQGHLLTPPKGPDQS